MLSVLLCGWAKLNVLQKRWLVCRLAALLILRRDSQTALPKIALSVGSFLSIKGRTVGLLGLLITVWRLAKVAIFTPNVDAENQTLINHKCVCGALNRHFCQTPVCALNGKYSSFNYLKEARE